MAVISLAERQSAAVRAGRERRRRAIALVELLDRLEVAAHSTVPAAAQYAVDWAPPEDVERWYTAEQLHLLQSDLQQMRAAVEDLFLCHIGRGWVRPSA